ncbi:TrkA C-terminal domain-containing protein [Halopiger djelfimassiliensis]|uniref:TrkA C-terminal domain-containing protein n=1 Tax=Halopiger djelfimassiliensis TaxID=1293047 RepID=UPI0006780E0A|nr:TrkA C-terminal domain-containing protein [Halopiger djelfimassiliensis]
MIVTQAIPLPAETPSDVIVWLLLFTLLAGGTATGAAVAFRWYSADSIPEGVAILVGIAPVALWLNTQSALQDAIIGRTSLLDPETAVFTIVAFLASAIAADGGRRVGDYLARNVFWMAGSRTIDDVGQLVRAAGRVVAVELPAEIDEVDGYDPVDPTTTAELAGQTFLFPRRLSTEQLRDRLIDRLERDYGIGHVDVEIAADGTVESLAVGGRPAGIGPTLAPGTVAVALRGDPAPDASPGDAVRIWLTDGESTRRLAEGELRGIAGETATVAIDADDAADLETDAAYRLVTLPGTPGGERELVSLLRAANETVTTRTIDAADPLVGTAVDSLPVVVLALERDREGTGKDDPGEGTIVALPDGETRLQAGDTAHVLGRPESLRRLAEWDGSNTEER